MKKTFILAMLMLGFSLAQMSGMPPMAGPAHAVPNYNGFVLENFEILGIDEARIDKIKAFKKTAGPIMKAMLDELQAINAEIKQAALDGLPLEELLALEQKVEIIRVKATSSKTDCRDNTRNILGEELWQKTTDLYRKSLKEKPKMELYSAMPMLGMPLMVHMNDLDLKPEQKKIAMMMPSNNMPLMDRIKADISALYKEIKIASLDGKSKGEILELEKKIEEKRIELMKTEATCRTEIRELLNDDQWNNLLGFYADMQKDMSGSAAEVAEKKENMKPMKVVGSNNKVEIENNKLWLEPIVANNNLYLGLHFEQAEKAKMFLKSSINDHSSAHIIDLEEVSLIELGPVQTGIWDFSGKLHNNEFNFHISVYEKEENDQIIYLLFAPTPSLSGLGKSQIMVFLDNSSSPMKKDMTVSWNMPGMEHSTDTKVIELSQSNYDSSYPSVLSDSFLYTAPISFVMVGDWDINLSAGKEKTTIRIQMLDD